MSSPRFRVQKSDDRWLVIQDTIKDDCPILSDWDTKAEAEAEIKRILKEEQQWFWENRVKRALDSLPDVPQDQRGFGV